jgi:hypothetical protein
MGRHPSCFLNCCVEAHYANGWLIIFISAPNLIVSAADAAPVKSNGSDQGILAVLAAFQLVIHRGASSQNALCQAAECEGDKKRVFT